VDGQPVKTWPGNDVILRIRRHAERNSSVRARIPIQAFSARQSLPALLKQAYPAARCCLSACQVFLLPLHCRIIKRLRIGALEIVEID
jgi:hypothetical protein